MKIKMEIDENLQDEEIIVRCRELSDDVVAMQRRIAEAVHAGMRLAEILSDCPLGHFGGKKRYMDRLSFQKRQNQSVRSGVRFQKRRQESYFALSGTCRNHVE